MSKTEYIIVWLLTILTFAVVLWLIYSPLSFFKEIPASPVTVHQVYGNVLYAGSDTAVQPGDIIAVGQRVVATNSDDQLILALSSRSFVHVSDGFDLHFTRIEDFRLPVLSLNSGWLNFRRFLADVRVPSTILTPSGSVTLSTESHTWLRHPFSEVFVTVTPDYTSTHVPNGPAVWSEANGNTTIRSGSYFTAARVGSQRSVTELPQAPVIVSPEDERPNYLPGDLARGFTLSWRSEVEGQRYVVRIDEDSSNLPVLQVETLDRAYTVSGLSTGSYMARVGNISTGKGVSRWSDGFPFTVSSRATDIIDCNSRSFSANRIRVGDRLFIVGCAPVDDQPVHIGVYALGDVWYLQSGDRGRGVTPEQDRYFEISVVEANEYRIIVQSAFQPFRAIASNLESSGSIRLQY